MADVSRHMARWVEAGVIDAGVAARIQAFEDTQQGARGWSWTVRIVFGFGGILLAAGVLLFIGAHWDALGPAARFSLLVGIVGALHVAAAAVSTRVPALASMLHAVGTVSFGGAIYLAGQIFNLDAHWPAGLMLWALGAAAGWLLLRDGPQVILLATLAPAWLVSEWVFVAGDRPMLALLVSSAGVLLLALTYLTASASGQAAPGRRGLSSLGAIALLPAALAFASAGNFVFAPVEPVLSSTLVFGWSVAMGLPLLLAGVRHRANAWPHVVAALWIGLHVLLVTEHLDGRIPTYGWWALAAAGLAAWGVRDRRPTLINFAFAIFGATVVTFYFADMTDMLGRSAGLMGLGVLLLSGGLALERGRRHLIRSVKGEQQ